MVETQRFDKFGTKILSIQENFVGV